MPLLLLLGAPLALSTLAGSIGWAASKIKAPADTAPDDALPPGAWVVAGAVVALLVYKAMRG